MTWRWPWHRRDPNPGHGNGHVAAEAKAKAEARKDDQVKLWPDVLFARDELARLAEQAMRRPT